MEGQGTRNNPAFVRERSQYRRAGWMVWGGISIGVRTDYISFWNGIFDWPKNDNARPHSSSGGEHAIAETIQRMEWPAYII
ncbi:hypothetical protein TNCV_4566441 [Trichonephila clavipes]|nr:hypothetical protein TNCV_4566441 [Trichonephila clavipes]